MSLKKFIKAQEILPLNPNTIITKPLAEKIYPEAWKIIFCIKSPQISHFVLQIHRIVVSCWKCDDAA
jgi:hypothetical protein